MAMRIHVEHAGALGSSSAARTALLHTTPPVLATVSLMHDPQRIKPVSWHMHLADYAIS